MRPVTARASLPASQRRQRTPAVQDLFQGPPPEAERCFTAAGSIKHFEVLPDGGTLLLTRDGTDSALICLEPDGSQRWRYTPQQDWTLTSVHRGPDGAFHLSCDVAGREFAGYKQVDAEGTEQLSLVAEGSGTIRSARSRPDGMTCVVVGQMLHAFDPTGKLLWKRSCAAKSTLFDFLPEGQPVVCSESKGFLGRGFRFHTRALDPQTGKTVGEPATFRTWPRQVGPRLAASLGGKDSRVEAASLPTAGSATPSRSTAGPLASSSAPMGAFSTSRSRTTRSTASTSGPESGKSASPSSSTPATSALRPSPTALTACSSRIGRASTGCSVSRLLASCRSPAPTSRTASTGSAWTTWCWRPGTAEDAQARTGSRCPSMTTSSGARTMSPREPSSRSVTDALAARRE